jgi:hypothetical protein
MLKWVLPKDKDDGRRYIIKLEDEDGLDEWYMEWSTNTHSPLCKGMTKSRFREWYLNKYKNYSPMRLEARLDDVDAFGSDKPKSKSVEDIIGKNRAGRNGYPLSKEELINMYCESEFYDEFPQLEEYQKVSFSKDRFGFLANLKKEVKYFFPDVVSYIEQVGGQFDPENETCAKAILALIDDEQVTIETGKDTVTHLWTCKIQTTNGKVHAIGEGFDNNRNVAFCVAVVNWKTQIEARDQHASN